MNFIHKAYPFRPGDLLLTIRYSQHVGQRSALANMAAEV